MVLMLSEIPLLIGRIPIGRPERHSVQSKYNTKTSIDIQPYLHLTGRETILRVIPLQ